MTADKNPLLESLHHAVRQVESVVLGKPDTVRISFACLLAGGHLLLDDLPGMGKTTLARTLAHSLGLSFHRVQATSDLLPTDILGLSIYDNQHKHFQFHPGPIFCQALLVDEINRASPRTQSALLESMAERQVTMDGHTHPLPEPFFVIATQNPVDLSGTFPLPDSQLDRFMVRLELGYPDERNEMTLLQQDGAVEPASDSRGALTAPQVLELQAMAQRVNASEPILLYVQRLLTASRTHPGIRTGLSPRAGIALMRLARAMALLDRRAFVIPEDVQAIFPAVAGHRLLWKAAVNNENEDADRLADLIESVPVP